MREGSIVTIGMPVFNGENYLEEAVAAITSQSLDDFTLMIVDNASTDRTVQIASDLANTDERIVLAQNESNIGAPANFNAAFASSSSKYFKWAAHDDLLDPTYLESCVDFLEANSDYVMCHSRTRVVDTDGSELREYAIEMPNLDASRPAERFSDAVLVRHACYEAFSVMRAQVLSQTPLIGSYLSSDRCLIAEMALRGKVKILPEKLYLNRDHQNRSIRTPTHQRARSWFLQGDGSIFVYPSWRLLAEYSRAISRVPMPAPDRWASRRVLVRWIGANWRLLRGDVRLAAVDLWNFLGSGMRRQTDH